MPPESEAAVAEPVVEQAQQPSDIDRLRSSYDKRVSLLERELESVRSAYADERRINDDTAQTLAQMKADLAEMRDAGMDNLDPEVRDLRAKLRAAEEKAAQADSFARRQAVVLKEKTAGEYARDLFPDDAEARKQAKDALMDARNPEEMRRKFEALNALAAGRREGSETRQRPAGRDAEFDEGRSSGAGRGTKISRAVLQQHENDADGGLAWFREHKAAIDAWVAEGAPE